MSDKKINLEQLFDEIRTLGEQFQVQEEDVDIITLKPHELSVFTEELQRIVKEFLNNELDADEFDEYADSDVEELVEMYWLDEEDDDLE